jgi:PAS domain S-box-containing protein
MGKSLGDAGISAGITAWQSLLESYVDITERKLSEDALAKNYNELHETMQRLERSKNMLQLIIESVPARVFWKDKDLRYLGCNTLFARDAGFSDPQHLLGKDDFSMGWKDQADLYRTDDRQVMESRRPKLNIPEPQTTPAGGKIWLNTSKVPLQMPDGEVFGVLGFMRISPSAAWEEALEMQCPASGPGGPGGGAQPHHDSGQ